MRTPVRSSRLLRFFCIGALALTVAACAPRVATRGNQPDPELLAEIEPGEISRLEVEEILGSPSTTATFGQEAWYYISERTETTAFFAPEVAERHVVVIRFDDKGMVAAIDNLTLEDGRVIRPTDRETPTAGNELTFLEQMFGNLGRFNK